MKPVKIKLARAIDKEPWSSVGDAVKGRKWVDQALVPVLALSMGLCVVVASAGAQEMAPVTSAQNQRIVQELIDLRKRRQQEVELLQESINQLNRSQQQIDALQGEVAALQKQLREHHITPVSASAPAVQNTAASMSASANAVAAHPLGDHPPVASIPALQGGATQAIVPASTTSDTADAASSLAATGMASRTVSSITLAARDITRPQSASTPGVGMASGDCGEAAATSNATAVPVLTDQAAADTYRTSLAHLGEVSAEPGLPTTDLDGLRAKLGVFVGQPMDGALVQKITAAATTYVSGHTDNLVDVYVPPQSMQSGNLVVVLATAKLGRIRTEGQKHISSHDLGCQIRLRAGDPVNVKTLTDDLTLLNTSPWRQVSSSFTPGAAPGEADLVLQTVDQTPVRVYGSWDNTGSALTGLNRWRAGINWGDAFGVIGSRLDYSFTTTNSSRNLMEHALLYTMPTRYRDTVTFTGDYSSSDVPIENGVFRSQGKNIQLGAQWTHPFGGPALAGSQFTSGFEYKHIGNALLFNDTTQINSAPNLYQFYMGAQLPWVDSFGSNSLNGRVTIAPGFNSDAAFNAARVGATSDYQRADLTYDRYVNLTAGFSLHGRFNGQWASSVLISSERLPISGAAGVRGYREDVLSADSGYTANIEALTPAVSVPVPFVGNGVNGQLQGVAFYDFGQAFARGSGEQNQALGATAKEFTLASAGVGARFNINQYLSLKTDLGWRLRGPSSLPGYVIHGSLLFAY
jgi:hemolysin activation/secretion protein/TolA-binding protein